MGRSRFPGRPTKYTHRIRINVLPESTTTFGVSTVSMTVGPDDISKKNNSTVVNSENAAVNGDNLKLKRVDRKRCKTLSKRRNCKRNVLINSTRKTTLNSKISVVGHVSRRAKTKVKSRRSVRNFTTLQKVANSRFKSSSLCDTNNLVGKFVLPSRSVHSSRVIKPNKRFINIESADNRTFRKKKCLDVKLKCTSETKALDSSTQTTITSRPLLREARLQIGTKSTLASNGPFSLTSNIGTSSGYVTCGVCGARRFNRLLKQVKKFNSCESCRQFISKMLKRQKCKSINVVLSCQNGQGTCVVSTVTRSAPNKGRCSACWLKMCLKSFQLPLSLHNSLVQLLPPFMNDKNPLFGGSSFPLKPWPLNVNETAKIENSYNESVAKPAIETTVARQRPIRLKPVKKEEKPADNVRGMKRQKIDLKGPRVKHVCRSASIVLGQPLATFPSTQNLKEISAENKKDETTLQVEPQEMVEEATMAQAAETEPAAKEVALVKPKPELINASRLKKEKVTKAPTITNTEPTKMLPLKKTINKKTGICIDFWESYDPDEICKNGFCIIGSEPLPLLPICFLCGSGGREPLLHCSLCCEPYHFFCLEQAPPHITNNNQRLNWLCPRCTKCTTCGLVDRQKINCQKCHKDYHPECFNDKWRTNDRPLVCSSCLRCKSCSSENITKFVGNIPLCIACFKLRKKGNFCPLCQKCYEENDYESKMMECNKCKKWIHARCENLTDEQYQILSILPESLEYQCNTCCNNQTGTWRQAIQTELRSSFNTVLRLLSKNKIARNIIKWSPIKTPSTVKTLSSAKRLQFIEENENVSEVENEEQETDVNKKLNFKMKECEVRNENRTPMSPTMVEIKNKLNSCEYMSLRDFNAGMKQALFHSDSELYEIYCSIMKKVFPWFDPDNNEGETTEPTIVSEQKINLNLSSSEKYITTTVQVNEDARSCILCKVAGDGLSHQESRLLYCGHNEWIHANCALWSSEVYEEIDGSLQNVPSAISRGRSIRCAKCKHKGASVGCCQKGCYETYHFRCAQLVRCYFLHDKTVYCNSHDVENKSSIITIPTEFHINRSVYIELDKKKKKFLEPEKVNFMVGSLAVSNLGKIIPVLSDTSESLLPTGFVCTRLFWSTVEPWKLVPYLITTSVLNTSANTAIERNFTIDHSRPKHLIDKKLRELNVWLKDIEKADVDSDYEEEQQDNMLPAELMNDDIFEVLQHDFLDEISVQDMLMSYEELLNMDFKNSEINCNDNIINSDNLIKKNEDDDGEFELKSGKTELKRCKSEVFTQITELSKARSQQRSCSLTFSCKMDNSISPVIKKRKINQINRDNNMYLQLLQVDGAADSSESECGSPVHEIEDNWSNIEEPVTCEKCQCTYRTVVSYKRHLENCDNLFTSESDSEEQNASQNEQNQMESNAIMIKINEEEPQMITSYESYSTYHATQSQIQTVLNTQTFVSEATNEVVTIPDNSAVYYPSYQQQIVPQKPITNIIQPQLPINQATITIGPNVEEQIATTSTAISNNQANSMTFCLQNQAPICVDANNVISVDKTVSTLNQAVSAATLNQTVGTTLNQVNTVGTLNQTVSTLNQPITATLNQSALNQTVALNQSASTINQAVGGSTLNQTLNPSAGAMNQTIGNINQTVGALNQSVSTTLNQAISTLNQSVSTTLNQSVSTLNQSALNQTVGTLNQASGTTLNPTVSAVGSLNQSVASLNQLTINPSASLTLNQPVEMQAQQMTIQQVPFSPVLNITPQNQITIDAKVLTNSNICNPLVVPQNQWMKTMGKPTLVAQKTIRPRVRPARNLAAKQNPVPRATVVFPQNNVNSVIFQHMPSTNMVPFVDQFQQTSQNLQYVAINQPQLVQIQPTENNFLSIPTMIIQQPRVVQDQLIVDSNGSMIWATQPVQPIYYNFETIVQNTYMQSQQFLPTTVPGVLTTNSSYSATTQVFQTSKLEPVLDVSSGNFVLVNNCPGQIINSQSIQSVQVPQTTQTVSNQTKNNVQWRIVETPATPDVNTHLQIKPLVTKSQPTNSITLPVAPFVSEQRIPTNIVTPTPKVPSTTQQQQVRPMNRVLPMQTINMKEVKKSINAEKLDKVVDDKSKVIAKIDKPKVQILQDINLKNKDAIKYDEELLKVLVEPIKPTIDLIKTDIKQLKTVIDIKQLQSSNDIKQLKSISDIKQLKNVSDLTQLKNVSDIKQIKSTIDNKLVKNTNDLKQLQSVNEQLKVENEGLKTDCMNLNIISNVSTIQADENEIIKPMFKKGVPFEHFEETISEKAILECDGKDKIKIEITEPADVDIAMQQVNKIEIDIKPEIKPTILDMPKLHDLNEHNLDSFPESNFKRSEETVKLFTTQNDLKPKKPIIIEKEISISKKDEFDKKLKAISKSQEEKFKIINNSCESKEAIGQSSEPKQSVKEKLVSNQPSILYTVETQEGFKYSSTSIADLWGKVFEAIQNARLSHNMTPLPPASLEIINNLQLLGLKTNGLKYLIEQLPGASKCTKYKPTFHTLDQDLESFVDHAGGAVRCVVHPFKKDEHVDMFGWLASKHRNLEHFLMDSELMPRRGSTTNLPMAMRFRALKTTSKTSVGVYRSEIHGRGLFALRNFESGEMVIEYSGEVIRSILTDKREKYYNSKGIGCYMFRIDDNLVIDATMKGNAARFINHSCDPNCYSKVVDIHGHKHIIIFALRKIICQEELTYDYKFPFEEDKIPCTCGARRCRKFLN